MGYRSSSTDSLWLILIMVIPLDKWLALLMINSYCSCFPWQMTNVPFGWLLWECSSLYTSQTFHMINSYWSYSPWYITKFTWLFLIGVILLHKRFKSPVANSPFWAIPPDKWYALPPAKFTGNYSTAISLVLFLLEFFALWHDLISYGFFLGSSPIWQVIGIPCRLIRLGVFTMINDW